MDIIEDLIEDTEEVLTFHSNVRENIIFVLIFLLLLAGSYVLIERFRRRDREDIYSTDDDELTVYRITLLFCIFSFSIAIGSIFLLPISIMSNEAIFLLLPFAYLFSESSGFIGYKKGIISRLYETLIVFALVILLVVGFIYIILSLIDPERCRLFSLLSITTIHLPFLYSCVSFIGVLILLVCTPIGFIKLFGIIGQLLGSPRIKDSNEDFQLQNFERASFKRKTIDKNQPDAVLFNHLTKSTNCYKYSYISLSSKLSGNLEELSNFKHSSQVLSQEKSLLEIQLKTTVTKGKHLKCVTWENHYEFPEMKCKHSKDNKFTAQRIENLNKKKHASKTLWYLALLFLLLLTSITVLLVLQNTIELLIGIKALPSSSRQFTLGISSLSKLGVFGATLEVLVICYLGITSFVGLYTLPQLGKIRPKLKKTSLNHLIVNITFALVLTSALPLLSRILGITNFDLLGEYGEMEWLRNFVVILLYNIIFMLSAVFCIIKKFSLTLQQELLARVVENYLIFISYVSFIN
ncbi:CLUMA_CG000218, isoform A [Clunio marinus]|uniref:CLUMA_CG000218, isoform A n=1 Tax=Clunio marinus TaxID=568069 RepID=A0A1J1HFG4_9DIPT|nr:CLUMA_CG000218, isoform A [Clunio marinus]